MLLYYQNTGDKVVLFFLNTLRSLLYLYISWFFLGKGPQVTERQMNGRGEGRKTQVV